MKKAAKLAARHAREAPRPTHRLTVQRGKLNTSKRNRCEAMTKDGAPCEAAPMVGKKTCLFHNGDNASKCGRVGGRRRAVYNLDDLAPCDLPRTTDDVLRLLGQTILELRSGKIDVRMSNAICFASGAFLNAVELTTLEAQMRQLEAGLLGRETGGSGPVAAPPRQLEG
jgi:hypothetical protein